MKKLSFVRLFVFAVSTVSLASFFEAGRKITSEQTFAYVLSSLGSLFIFLFSLLILGYWVYSEEKEKNNLKIRFGLYEWIYEKFIEMRNWRDAPSGRLYSKFFKIKEKKKKKNNLKIRFGLYEWIYEKFIEMRNWRDAPSGRLYSKFFKIKEIQK